MTDMLCYNLYTISAKHVHNSMLMSSDPTLYHFPPTRALVLPPFLEYRNKFYRHDHFF